MRREQGYTLIETVLAVMLVIILSSAGLYGWQRWQQQERLWQTAWQLRDYLYLLRDDANWHNCERIISIRREASGWRLLGTATDNLFCPPDERFTFRPTWAEVELVDLTPGLGFYGLRNTARAGHIRLRSEAGEWLLVVSDWGRIRLCERSAEKGRC